MNCSRSRESLHSFINGSLGKFEEGIVAEHLQCCKECRIQYRQIQKNKLLFSRYTEAAVPLEDLKAGIMGAINLKRYSIPRKRPGFELRKWGLSIIAAGLILFTVNTAGSTGIDPVQRYTLKGLKVFVKHISSPVSNFSSEFQGFTQRVFHIDGITGRIERQLKGGL